MGDTFHQTNAQQTATNQQIGISTRDVGGNVITIGHGAVSGGGSLSIQSLDPKALDVAALAVNDAIASNANTAQNALQAYQKALDVVGEQANQALALAKPATVGGINPSTIIWGGIALVGVVLLIGALRSK
jgi:hypothetical protein